MRDILDDLTRWLAAGERVALATVVWAEGSSPRPLGARMAVRRSASQIVRSGAKPPDGTCRTRSAQ